MRTDDSSQSRGLPTAAIFDVDGLLVNTEPLHAEAFVRTFADFGLSLTIEEFRQAITLGGGNTRQLHLSLGGDSAKWDEVIATKHAAFAPLLEQKGRVMPGVVELLQSLREAGVPTAVATSARRRSLEIIGERFGLLRYFDASVTYEDVRVDKPEPDAFLLAASQLGAQPSHCVVFEDSARGVLAANRAGMKCVAVPTDFTADSDFSLATLIVDSLEQVDLHTLRALFRESNE